MAEPSRHVRPVQDAPAIVIFGAAARADGRPSPALARRIGYGLEAATDLRHAPILCSGAAGPPKPRSWPPP